MAHPDCPHCASRQVVKNGSADGLQRFKCRGCRKSFNALTGTPLARLHMRGKWLDHTAALRDGLSLNQVAERLHVAQSTAFRWRHRFLALPKTVQAQTLSGIAEADIEKSLRGNWREEHLFALGQAMALFDAYGEQLHACDRQLEAMLAALQPAEAGEPGKAKRRSRAKNAPKFDVRAYLFGMCGVDLTRINGIDTTTALKVISEVGQDMSRFKSAKHFASWLGLCPGTKISGGKVLSGASKRTANRAAQALRLAAAAHPLL